MLISIQGVIMLLQHAVVHPEHSAVHQEGSIRHSQGAIMHSHTAILWCLYKVSVSESVPAQDSCAENWEFEYQRSLKNVVHN